MDLSVRSLDRVVMHLSYVLCRVAILSLRTLDFSFPASKKQLKISVSDESNPFLALHNAFQQIQPVLIIFCTNFVNDKINSRSTIKLVDEIKS